MEFKIGKKDDDLLQRYPTEDMRIANAFTRELQKELQDFLVAVVLFGSTARKKSSEKSDIDVLLIGNDVEINMTNEFIETYKIILEKLIAKHSTRLHVTSMTFTSFWDYARAGDPVTVNILRDGVALYDIGFFRPTQMLLRQGRIRPSEESLWRYFSRAPKSLTNSRWHVLQATLDLYWAVIDSAHAALMKKNIVPPSPEHVADMLQEVFASKRQLEARYVASMRKFYQVSKGIVHRDTKEVSGLEYEALFKEATDFVNRMKKLIYAH